MRKALTWIGSLILLILISVTLGIFLNKNKIRSILLTELNKNINGQASLGDIDISVVKSFPYMGINLKNFVLVDPALDTTIQAKQVTVKLNLPKLVFSKLREIEINQLIFDKPKLKTRVNTSGEFNLAKIIKKTEKSDTINASFQLNSKLEKILILDGTFSHIDSSADPYSIYLDNLNSKAFGTLTDNDLKLDFTNLFDHFTYISENLTYLKQVKGNWTGIMNYDMNTSNWTISKNQIVINALKTNVNGNIKSTSGALNFDLDVFIPENNITDLISIIPGAMANQYDKLLATGKFSLTGSVKGTFDSIGHKPMIKFKTIINNGTVKYNHLPYSLSDINLEASANSLDSFANKFHILLPASTAKLNGSPLHVHADILYNRGYISNAKGSIKTNLKLDEITNIFPLDQTTLEGVANIDLSFNFSESQVLQKQFDQMKLDGIIEGNNIKIKLAGNPQLNIQTLNARFTPQLVDIKIENGRYGKSDMAIQSKVFNPIALATEYKNLASITLHTTSNVLDINELTNWGCDTCSNSDQPNDLIPRLHVQFDSKINNLKYHDLEILNTNVSGSFIRDSLIIKTANTVVNDSKLKISGILSHPYLWTYNKYKLSGNLAIDSDLFDFNPYLDTSTSDPKMTASTPEKVLPANTDLTFEFKSSAALYRQLKLSNLKTNATIINQKLNIESGNAIFSGGTLSLTGVFSESELLPAFDMKIEINQMKVDEVMKNTSFLIKIAPIARFLGGLFSTSSIIQGSLDKNMNPVWTKLDAAGVIEVINGKLNNFKLLEELSKKIQIPILKNINWEKSKNWFVIEKGMVNIKPFIIPNKDIYIQLRGSHYIEQNIDYVLTTGVPKKIFDHYKVNPNLNPDLTWLRNELKAKGIPIQELDTFYFETSIKGTIYDPIVVTKWVARPGGKSYSEQVKEDVENAVREKADSIKESVESKIENKKDSLLDLIKNEVTIKKEQLDSIKNAIQDSIKKIADAKVKEIIDSVIKKETTRILDSSLQSKVDTFINKNAKEEIEKINEKLKNWNPLKKKKKEN